jgi:hypothetical protein
MVQPRERNILWRRLDATGLEHLRLLVDAKGSIADGLVISVESDRAFRLQYQVRCDSEWRCRSAEIVLLGSEADKLILTKQPEENWIANGRPVEGSINCVDVDISATPFTNTLPIRRLKLEAGQSSEISALYILVPALTVRVAKQTYRRMRQSRAEATYVYQGLDRQDYRVMVDADGLVTEYEGIFARVSIG